MFDIKDGKVQATFQIDGKTVVETLDPNEVKVAIAELVLVALQRVSRETVAGLAQDEPAKAREKMLKRWTLWKAGTWEAERAKSSKLSDEEVTDLVWSVLEFKLAAGKVKDAKDLLKRAKASVAAKEPDALARFEKFKAEHAKAIKQRMKEVLDARKNAATLTY